MGPRFAAIDRTGGSDAGREIRLAAGARRAIRERSLHAHRVGELLSVERNRSEKAGRHDVGQFGKDRNGEGGRDRLVEAVARSRKGGTPGGETGRPDAEGESEWGGCHGGWHVSSDYRSRQ